MAILQSLGITDSFFFQLIVFTIAIVAISLLVYRPYLAAFEMREKQTKGEEQLAGEIQVQADQLRHQYETKARQVNSEIKTIFDEYRDQANKEVQNLVSKARQESQKLIDEARKRVSTELAQTTQDLKVEIPQVAAAITQRFLAK